MTQILAFIIVVVALGTIIYRLINKQMNSRYKQNNENIR